MSQVNNGFTLSTMLQDELMREHHEPEHKEFPYEGRRALYTWNTCEVWVIVGEEVELDASFDCEPPPGNHWLAYELEHITLCELVLGCESDEHSIATGMLQMGVAPGQPFKVWLRATYTRDYWGEHDADYDSKFLESEPWEQQRAADAWSKWMKAIIENDEEQG